MSSYYSVFTELSSTIKNKAGILETTFLTMSTWQIYQTQVGNFSIFYYSKDN